LNTKIFIIAIFLLSIVSCVKVPNNGIPSYIKLESVSIETDSVNQGSTIHGIKDLWVESEGVDIGAYEFPITFAALLSGNKKIIINAGVWFNDKNTDHRIYPVLETYTAIFDFVEKDTVVIKPVFKYKAGVDFLYIEDFTTNNNFDKLERSELSDVNNLEGKCGVLTLSANDKTKTAISTTPIEINVGNRVYVEISFKSEAYIGFGIESAFDNKILSTFAIYEPTPEWHTAYFEITEFISSVKAGQYKFFLNAQKNEDGKEEKVYFDNFKILQF